MDNFLHLFVVQILSSSLRIGRIVAGIKHYRYSVGT